MRSILTIVILAALAAAASEPARASPNTGTTSAVNAVYIGPPPAVQTVNPIHVGPVPQFEERTLPYFADKSEKKKAASQCFVLMIKPLYIDESKPKRLGIVRMFGWVPGLRAKKPARQLTYDDLIVPDSEREVPCPAGTPDGWVYHLAPKGK